ncbi:hypothetical protein E4U58_004634 [Claviceps cyperi]|nr:hypothetical protein E4U58_004634 [Claviceps cyperi]
MIMHQREEASPSLAATHPAADKKWHDGFFARDRSTRDAAQKDHQSHAMDSSRSWTRANSRDDEAEAPQSALQSSSLEPRANHGEDIISPRLSQLYTLFYLVFFAIMGTLARLGLSALTSYANMPVLFTGIWANFGGCVIMGFLIEDQMLFQQNWRSAADDGVLTPAAEQNQQDGASHTAAKKAHVAYKKTVPLYIGLTTGFCGSFTSFSTFIRDVFLAMSNDMSASGRGVAPESRNGGYSFLAMAAVVITTVALSLGGLVFGGHCAMAIERFVPSLSRSMTRRLIDPLFVLLGWGCWVGAIVMAVLPPHDAWRGQVLFALVFAPLGCLARYGLALWLNGKTAALPLGTLAANITGTAVLGMAWDLAHVRSGGLLGCQVLQGVEDGFCGCLTTVSTWAAELNSLGRRSAYMYGLTSVLVSFAFMVLIMGGLRWTDGWSALLC